MNKKPQFDSFDSEIDILMKATKPTVRSMSSCLGSSIGWVTQDVS